MTHPELDAALAVLGNPASAVPASAFHGQLPGVGEAGMYSWWADAAGAAALSSGLGHAVAPGLIYAGQTGATRWPSGKPVSTSLRGRVGGQHIGGGVYGSTFRLTLAAVLRETLKLELVAPKRLSAESEQHLRAWIESHLAVVTYPVGDRDTLGALEQSVLTALDPPLNLDRERPDTPLRQQLRKLRKQLAAGA